MDKGKTLMSFIWTSVRLLTQYPITSCCPNWKDVNLMGRLMDEELDAGSSPKSVWMETGDKWLVLGLILFISGADLHQ